MAASNALFFSISGFLLAGVSPASDIESTAVKRRFGPEADTTMNCVPLKVQIDSLKMTLACEEQNSNGKINHLFVFCSQSGRLVLIYALNRRSRRHYPHVQL
jgi:hypothetical protein